MQQISKTKQPPRNKMVEEQEILDQIEEISISNKKVLQQLVVLMTTTRQWFDFCKKDLIKIDELQKSRYKFKAKNRAEKRMLIKQAEADHKEFKKLIGRVDMLLSNFSNPWEDDNSYSEFIDESIDAITEALDKVELYKNKNIKQ